MSTSIPKRDSDSSPRLRVARSNGNGPPIPALYDRPLPADPDAEKSLLGALMQSCDPAQFAELAAIIGDPAAAFFTPKLAGLWRCFAALIADGKPIDIVYIRAHYGDAHFEKLGGAEWLASVACSCGSHTRAKHYAALIRDAALRREMVSAAHLLASATFNGDGIPELAGIVRATAVKLESGDGRSAGVSLADVTAASTAWLWRDRIPVGGLTLVSGRAGRGKSLFLADLIARVTSGSPMPFACAADVGQREPRSVLLLDSENDPGVALRPRIEKAAGDVSRVRVVSTIRGDDGIERLPRLPDDVPRIRDIARSIPGLAMIALDPLGLYMSGDAHKHSEVYGCLNPLGLLARDLGVACILVHHRRKDDAGGNAEDAAIGSMAFNAASRSHLSVVTDPDDEARLLLTHVKASLSPKQATLAFSIDGAGGAPSIRWLEMVNETADEVQRRSAEVARRPTKLDEAMTFIRAELAAGPVPSAELERRVAAAGIADSTYRRARLRLGIGSRQERDGPLIGEWVSYVPTSL